MNGYEILEQIHYFIRPLNRAYSQRITMYERAIIRGIINARYSIITDANPERFNLPTRVEKPC